MTGSESFSEGCEKKELDINSISNNLAHMIKKYGRIIALISEIKALANDYIVCRLKSMGIKGLVASHGNILGMLYIKGPSRMADISHQINRKKNTVTTLVNKLEKQGYVEIKPDENDLRSKIVSLTPKSIEMRDDFFSLSYDLIDTTLKDFSEEERYQLMDSLEQIRKNFK